MRQRLLPALLLTALLGCSKSDSNPIVDFGEGEGITYRDSQNYQTGPRDPTDWTSDGEWNKQERALFPDLSFDLNGTQRASIDVTNTLYANPSRGGQATWRLLIGSPNSTTSSFKIEAVLVSREYEVMKRLGPVVAFSGFFNQTFNYPSLGMSPNEVYRLYYVFYDSAGILYKGHGDIRYSPQ